MRLKLRDNFVARFLFHLYEFPRLSHMHASLALKASLLQERNLIAHPLPIVGKSSYPQMMLINVHSV